MKRLACVTTWLCVSVYLLPLLAAQPGSSKPKIVRISATPNSGRDRDISTGWLFDGDTKTGYKWAWANTTLLLMDLGEEKTFSGVNLYAVGGSWSSQLPFYRVLAGPNENELYRLAENHDRDNLPVFSDEPQIYKLATEFTGVKARYLMLDIRPLNWNYSLREIELMECDEKAITLGEFRGEALSYENYYEKTVLGNRRPYPTEEYVTPHVKWAKPLAGTKLKALFLISHQSCRDIIELTQRVDLDWKMVGTLNSSSSPMHARIVRQLDKALDGEWDVLVMGATRWIAVPEHLQAKIIDKVKTGLGLLYIQPRFTSDRLDNIIQELLPAEDLLKGVPLELVQFLNKPAEPYILKGEIGKGRIVVMQHEPATKTEWWTLSRDWWWDGSSMLPPIMPPESEPSQSCEYALSAIIRAMLSAAGRELIVPDLSIVNKHGDFAAQISFNEESKQRYVFQTAVHDARMKLIQGFGLRPLQRGVNNLWLPKDLPYGANTVNCWIKNDEGKIAGWASAVLNINDTHIESIDVEEKPRKAGETIQGVLRIKHGKMPVIKCEITLVDNYGRIVDEYVVSKNDQESQRTFSLKSDRAISQGVKVVAKIYSKSERSSKSKPRPYLLDEKQVYVPLITTPDNDAFVLSSWGEYPFLIMRPYGVHFWKQSENLGVDRSIAHLNYWPRHIKGFNKKQWDVLLKPFSQHNIRPLIIYPAGGEFSSRPTNAENIRLAENSFYKKFAEELKHTALITKRWNALDFLWGDETKYFEDRTPQMLTLFRKHLEKEHGSLDALNESWQTRFQSWDQVVPNTYQDALKKQGNLGPFIEFRIFLEDTMLNYYKTAREAVQEIVPEARTGLSGTYEPQSLGNDWSKALKYMDFIIYYFDNHAGRLTREAVRSFGASGSVFQMWTGYDWAKNNEAYARYGAWIDVLMGFNGPAIFSSSSFRNEPYENMGVINPDFTFSNSAKWYREETREIKAGIGKLLKTSQPLSSPIGIYYSIESMRTIGLARWVKRFNDNSTPVNSTFRLFQDMQYKPFFIDRTQLFSGNAAARMKMLVLPAQFLLSDKEIASMKGFVKQGGALLCMGHPGYMNLRGELRRDYPMEEILGSRPKQDFWNHPVRSSRFTIGDRSSELVVADARTEFSDKVEILLRTDEGFPLLTKHSHGNGVAYFMNGFPNEYLGYRPDISSGNDLDPNSLKEKNARAFRALVDICLTDCGIRPEFRISSSSYPEPALPYFENLRFSNGKVLFNCFVERYIPYIRSINFAKRITKSDYRPLDVSLERKAHVYNVRKKQYLGYTDRITLPVAPCIANVIALSPKKVESLSLDVDVDAQRDVTIKVNLKGLEGTGFEPVVHVELYSPDGKLVEHYSKNISLDSKTLSGELMIKHALNDPGGSWKVRAFDTLSGMQDAVTISSHAPPAARQ